jgi:menaquinone-dependent protoporphyrinogen IX oxidase
MKALVLYDSKWGNTELVAKAIAQGIGGGAKALQVGDHSAGEADMMELLDIGSPVLAGRVSKPMQEFLKAHFHPSAPKRRGLRSAGPARFDERRPSASMLSRNGKTIPQRALARHPWLAPPALPGP